MTVSSPVVASLHGIGQATVVKVAKKGCFPLFCIGDVNAEIEYVEAQATKCMCTAYGKVAESCNSMTECRVKMWRSKTGKRGASSVKLCSIPPTNEAFAENVHRCHLQVAIWKAALLESPELDSTKYCWELDHIGILVPRTVHSGTLSAPPDILQLILWWKCGTVPPNAGRLTPMISESNVRHDYAICLGFSIQSQLFIH